jgi:hypothetical protein
MPSGLSFLVVLSGELSPARMKFAGRLPRPGEADQAGVTGAEITIRFLLKLATAFSGIPKLFASR